jgi:predicted enzyme related to lactoylglutathione lyase
MLIPIVRLLVYVQDVAALKRFYEVCFHLETIEEIPGEWAVLAAGGIELALHRVGKAYRRVSHDERLGAQAGEHATTKLVFSLASELPMHRERLAAAGAVMGEIKRYEGFPYSLCDGADPEGNMFQVMQQD